MTGVAVATRTLMCTKLQSTQQSAPTFNFLTGRMTFRREKFLTIKIVSTLNHYFLLTYLTALAKTVPYTAASSVVCAMHRTVKCSNSINQKYISLEPNIVITTAFFIKTNYYFLCKYDHSFNSRLPGQPGWTCTELSNRSVFSSNRLRTRRQWQPIFYTRPNHFHLTTTTQITTTSTPAVLCRSYLHPTKSV